MVGQISSNWTRLGGPTKVVCDTTTWRTSGRGYATPDSATFPSNTNFTPGDLTNDYKDMVSVDESECWMNEPGFRGGPARLYWVPWVAP